MALFSVWYANAWEVRLVGFLLPREMLILLVAALCISGVYFPLMQRRRKTHPDRIVLDDAAIEVPNSRLSTARTQIPFERIESVTLSELGVGFHVLDMRFEGRRFRLAENVFAKRSNFKVVVAVLTEKARPLEQAP